MNQAVALIGGAVVVCVLCLWGNLRELHRRRLLADTPTSKTLGVFIGLAELKGSAESDAPVTSLLAGQSCVHYAWSVEESWSRTVTETVTDSKGNTQTRTRHESGWTTVAHGGETIPFYLKDEAGIILVRPDGAKLETDTFFAETVGRDSALYYGKGPDDSIPDSDHRRRFTESGIALHASLYVVGPARERADVVAPEIAADPNAEMFLVSTRTEEKVKAAIGRWAWLWASLGFIITLVPFALYVADNHRGLPAGSVLLALLPAAGFLGAWAVGWVWMVHNSLVGLRQRVRQGWSLIDIQLKRRHDLIPQLAATIGGLGGHEREVQTAVARLRTQLEATPPGSPGADFSGLATTVRGVVEKYPQLTAQAGFAALQKELIETEQRVALARSYYNDITTEFATRLEIAPDRWVAALRGMRPEPLLQATDFERAVVRVDLR